MLLSCKGALDDDGACLNMASFVRGDTILLTVFYGFAERAGDDGKRAVSVLLGGVGRAIGADLIVCIADMFVTFTDAQGMEDYRAGKGPRPKDNPERTEALFVMMFTPTGPAPVERYYPYGRDDHGKVVWQDEGPMTEWTMAGGDIPDAWMYGLTTDAPLSARDMMAAASHYASPLQVNIMDPDTAKELLR
jgi:hypothetical protein